MNVVAQATAGGFSARISGFLNRIRIEPVTSDEDRESIFRLRYEAYLREGAITRNFTRRFTDGFDEATNAWLFGIYVDGTLASSIRIHVASPEFPESPGVSAFGDVLAPEIEKGAIIVDPNRFVADHALARRHPELPYATVRLGFLACEFFRADLGLATVRSEHQAFYKRLFGLRPLCEPRSYPTLIKPLSLMAIDYPSVRARNLERYPFLRSAPAELSALFEGTPLRRVARPPVFEPAVARPRQGGGRTNRGRTGPATGGPSRDQAADALVNSKESDS